MILALTNSGFNLELETNCAFQFITSAVRYHPTRQKVFPHSMPSQDQITHPCFRARERNLLILRKMEHAARAHSHALSSDGSARNTFSRWHRCHPELSHLIVFVSCTLTDDNQARQQTFAQSFRTFEYLPPTKAALVEHVKRGYPLKERHTLHDMYGANPSSPS